MNIKLKRFSRISDKDLSARELMYKLWTNINNNKGTSKYLSSLSKLTNPKLLYYKHSIENLCKYIAQLGTNGYKYIYKDESGTILEHIISGKITRASNSDINKIIDIIRE